MRCDSERYMRMFTLLVQGKVIFRSMGISLFSMEILESRSVGAHVILMRYCDPSILPLVDMRRNKIQVVYPLLASVGRERGPHPNPTTGISHRRSSLVCSTAYGKLGQMVPNPPSAFSAAANTPNPRPRPYPRCSPRPKQDAPCRSRATRL